MLKYNLKIALRKFWRDKFSTLFNIFGLSFGIACFILIALFINDDLGYDEYNHNVNATYRILREANDNGIIHYTETTPAPLKMVLKEEIPEISKVVRIGNVVQAYTSIIYQNKEFREPGIVLADSEIFDVFDFNILKGNPKTLLTELKSIVITKSYAEKIFGKNDPLGKIIYIKGDFNSDFIVSGIIDDVSAKSSIKFQCLCSFELVNENRWGIWNYETFILLKKNAKPQNLDLKFKNIENRYLNHFEEKVKLRVQPLSKIHLDLNPFNKYPTTIDNKPIFLFSFIGLLILLIACFNYIILATTNASRRNMEVGIQKAFGADKRQLIIQFLSESLILTIVATYFGVLLAENYLPILNQLTGKHISVHYNNAFSYLLLSLFSIILGILAGLYPAFFLSSLKPVNIFKSEFYSHFSYRGNLFRESLIVMQFIVSISLFIASITIQKQLEFIRQKDLGFDSKNILVLSIQPKEVNEKRSLLIENLLRYPMIINTASGSFLPGELGYCQNSWWEGLPPDDNSNMMDWISVDTNFLRLMKIKLNAGCDFTSGSKARQYILNKTAIQRIGWENPLGKLFDVIGRGEVIGVTEDFNFKSLHIPIKPLALCVYSEGFEYMYIKVNPDSISSAIQIIQKEWTKLFPQIEFNYSFLESRIENTYNTEMRTASIINYFAFIAIILSCLGIYCLVSNTTQQRTKEIGIRRVTGATTSDILLMISKDFSKWIAIAFIIACPIAYYSMNDWLRNFAYRTELDWWVFALAGILAFLTAFLTLSWQGWKAANKNPLDALRYE